MTGYLAGLIIQRLWPKY